MFGKVKFHIYSLLKKIYPSQFYALLINRLQVILTKGKNLSNDDLVFIEYVCKIVNISPQTPITSFFVQRLIELLKKEQTGVQEQQFSIKSPKITKVITQQQDIASTAQKSLKIAFDKARKSYDTLLSKVEPYFNVPVVIGSLTGMMIGGPKGFFIGGGLGFAFKILSQNRQTGPFVNSVLQNITNKALPKANKIATKITRSELVQNAGTKTKIGLRNIFNKFLSPFKGNVFNALSKFTKLATSLINALLNINLTPVATSIFAIVFIFLFLPVIFPDIGINPIAPFDSDTNRFAFSKQLGMGGGTNIQNPTNNIEDEYVKIQSFTIDPNKLTNDDISSEPEITLTISILPKQVLLKNSIDTFKVYIRGKYTDIDLTPLLVQVDGVETNSFPEDIDKETILVYKVKIPSILQDSQITFVFNLNTNIYKFQSLTQDEEQNQENQNLIFIKNNNYSSSAQVTIGEPPKQNFCWPTSGIITQYPFGSYSHKNHDAYDISEEDILGRPIYAPASGTIVYKTPGESDGYGNLAILTTDIPVPDFPQRKVILYFAHLIDIQENRYVNAGEIIGYVGNTGNSTGPHLHFEMTYKGSPYGASYPSGCTYPKDSDLYKLLDAQTTIINNRVTTCY